MSSPALSESVREQMGNFDLLERLGYGGMAEVWLARRRSGPGYGGLVALKRLLPHLRNEAELIKNLLDEARIASSIVHPNIVRVFGSAHEGAVFYVTMEYLEGITLARLMGEAAKRSCSIPLHVGVFIVSRVCHGLHHAHVQTDVHGRHLRIVHRDISPQNVMLTFDGGVKVLDFGIARARDRLSKTTRVGGLKGKYGYLSPELCHGEEVDWRADIHACGILLWELLAGQRLFKEEDPLVSVQRIIAGDVRPPRAHNEETPAELEQLALRALSTQRERRPQSARAMGLALDRFLADVGVDGATELAAYLTRLLGPANSQASTGLESKMTANQWLEFVPSAHPLERTQSGDAVSSAQVLEPLESETTDTQTSVASLDADRTDGVKLALHDAPTRYVVQLEAQPHAVATALDDGKALESRVCDEPTGSQDVAVAGRRRSRWRLLLVASLLVVGLGVAVRLASHTQSGTERTKVASRPRVPVQPEGAVSPGSEASEERPAASGQASAPEPVPPPAVPAAVQEQRRAVGAGGAAAPSDAGWRSENGADASADAGRRSEHGADASRQVTRTRSLDARGSLNLVTEPWTAIYRGKTWVGNTPLVRVELPVGRVRLRAVNQSLGIDRRIVVTIEAGKVTRAAFQFAD
jgi:serine/threonine protein kinase